MLEIGEMDLVADIPTLTFLNKLQSVHTKYFGGIIMIPRKHIDHENLITTVSKICSPVIL